jgi:hypothetical protein
MTNSSSSAASSPPSKNVGSRTSTGPVVVPIRGTDSDPLDTFAVEGELAGPVGVATLPRPSALTTKLANIRMAVLTGVAGAAIALTAGIFAFEYWVGRVTSAAPAVAALTGKATLNSRPAGVAVMIDGVARGVTPLDLELSAGVHDVVFHGDSGERRLTITVERNARLSENVDMPIAGVAASGEVDVTSDPAGARVAVDKTIAGRTPLKLKALAPGQHTLEFTQGSNTVTRVVDVTAGGSLNVFVSLAGAGAASGLFAVDAPVELRLIENGQLLGLSGSAPLTLSAGAHRVEFVNEQLELNVSRTVTIDRGKTTKISVPVPNGTLFANAAPWAEVFIDGRSAGITPLGNVAVPVGTHEITWRHPQLGERKRTVVVGARTPVRLSMDLSK